MIAQLFDLSQYLHVDLMDDEKEKGNTSDTCSSVCYVLPARSRSCLPCLYKKPAIFVVQYRVYAQRISPHGIGWG